MLVGRKLSDDSLVQSGELVRSKTRGDTYLFQRATRANGPAHDGKVLVQFDANSLDREFYASVFGLYVKDE